MLYAPSLASTCFSSTLDSSAWRVHPRRWQPGRIRRPYGSVYFSHLLAPRGIVRLRAQRASAEVVPAAEAGTLAIHRVSFTRSCFRCSSHRQHTPASSIDTRRIRGRLNPASPEKVLVCVEAGEGEIPATLEAVQVALRIVYEGRSPIPSSRETSSSS